MSKRKKKHFNTNNTITVKQQNDAGCCRHSYPTGLDTTISTWGAAFDSRMMLYTSFLVAPGNDFPFHCSTSSPWEEGGKMADRK